MTRPANRLFVAIGLMSLSLGLAVAIPAELVAAEKIKSSLKKPVKNPKFDPAAPQVDLFEAVDRGQVTVRLIPKSAKGGRVLIENKTDKPLTVKIPEAVAGVSIHSQIANVQAGQEGQILFGLDKVGAGNEQGPQQLGGGIVPGLGKDQPAGNNPGFGPGQGIGQGLFSVPAETVISLQFNSVCLEHGKPEPTSNSKYTLVPVSRISRDPVLYQLLVVVGAGKVDKQAAQVAAWHVANRMSFQELSVVTNTTVGSLTQTPDFSLDQITKAEQLVARARERTDELSREEENRIE
jgi:hypothetical protein